MLCFVYLAVSFPWCVDMVEVSCTSSNWTYLDGSLTVGGDQHVRLLRRKQRPYTHASANTQTQRLILIARELILDARSEPYPVWKSPPADGADELVGVVFLLVLVQHALYRVELEGQQGLGKPLVVQVQGVVFASCEHNVREDQKTRIGCLAFIYRPPANQANLRT